MRVEGACASGGLALSCGVDAIRAGADVVLIAGVEVQTTADSRTGADYLARASHYAAQRSIHDFVFPALFARRSAAYKRKYGATEEDIGRAAVKAYANASLNPLAHMRAKTLTLPAASVPSDANPLFLNDFEDNAHMKVHTACLSAVWQPVFLFLKVNVCRCMFLRSCIKLTPLFKLSDCSQVSDGGSALLLCSEAGLLASSLRASDAVEVLSASTRTASLYDAPKDLTCLTTCASAASSAYAEAKISASDIDVAEVHDCFTITELMMYEALRLCPPGSAAAMLRAHETDLSGRVPVNTGGGLVGFGHPVGATGVKQVVELWRQMKGKCGAYQLKTIPQIGVCGNMGGEFST